MKKLLSLLAVSLSALVLLSSCANDDSSNGSPETQPQEVKATLSDLKDTAWFSGDVEVSFPYENETLYINYMPDTLNTTKWISLSENSDGTFTAKIEWSQDVREIGKTSSATITKKNSTISVSCDFFNCTNMGSFDGVSASKFDVSKVPALKAEYLSNWSGSYTLNTSKYTLSVGAKLGVSASVSSYWNANVLNTTVDEDGVYDLLLAHSSSNNGSGSIDPGITGSEPFISQQGLFWSHLTLTPSEGSQWTVKWSSTWYNSPYEALQGTMDKTDTFTGPATTKITYTYNFWFGSPKLKEGGYGVEAENATKITTATFDSDLPTDETWKEILERAGEITIPEGKAADYWWYNTDSLSPILENSVYKLTDSWEPALKTYDFYLALKDKSAESGIVCFPGTYTSTAHTLVVTETGFTLDDVSYTFVECKQWQESEGIYIGHGYIVSDGEKTYLTYLMYYYSTPYYKIRAPKEYTGELSETSDFTNCNSFLTNGGRSAANLTKQ